MLNKSPLFVFLALIFLFVSVPEKQMLAQADSTVYMRMQRQAVGLQFLVSTKVAKTFLSATHALKPIAEPRTIWYRDQGKDVISPRAYRALDSEAQAGYERKELDADFYFNTRYGSPLAYVRLVDLAAISGFGPLENSSVADFGFGSIGQLKLMARSGAQVSGIEVDPLLKLLYNYAEDQGTMARGTHVKRGERGSVKLHFGSYPSDAKIVAGLSKNLDLFTAKNTLKRGYIKPEREADPRALIDLGVSDSVFLQHVHDVLAPSGLFLIYNLHPAQAAPDEKYIPWADGRSPFDREQFEQAGFEVLAFDVDDSKFARALGAALGWDADGMDLDGNLFATYTLVRRPKAKR